MLFPALCARLFFLCYKRLFLPHRVLHVLFVMSTEAASADLIKKKGEILEKMELDGSKSDAEPFAAVKMTSQSLEN